MIRSEHRQIQVYLVGGAVRDFLLNHPIKDRDYVVVGATEEDMFANGFKKIDATSFPVFHHPVTNHEFALARKERKVAAGYHGFETTFDPSVTLKEDLLRRDLTINSMAIEVLSFDQNGEPVLSNTVIDFHNGKEDLRNGILRHVSPAFAEDPLRILRVARFRARYNFSIAPETMEMMKELVANGECDHLLPERVWVEIEKTLPEPNPDMFFRTLEDCGAYHPLGFNFTTYDLSNLILGTRAGLSPALLFACLLFDLDSGYVTKLFDRYPVPTRIQTLCNRLRELYRFNFLKHDYGTVIVAQLKKIDAYRQPEYMDDIFKITEALKKFTHRLKACYERSRHVNFQSLTIEQCATLYGSQISAAIDELRIDRVNKYLNEERRRSN